MAIRRVRVIWTGLGGGEGLTVFHFNDRIGETATTTLTTLGAALSLARPAISNGVSYKFDPEVEILDETTGKVVSVQTGIVAGNGGTATGSAQPYATQGLLRLLTPKVVNGRRLRGRIFLPGVPSSAGDPVPGAQYLGPWEAMAAKLVTDTADNGEWVVYSRRYATVGVISNGSVWTNYAVMRSRRD